LQKNWPKQQITDRLVAYLTAYFNAIGVSVGEDAIKEEAGKMALLEWVLAQGQVEDDSDDYPRISIKNATNIFPKAVEWSTYFKTLAEGVPGLQEGRERGDRG
jgi:hypothetical protein